MLLSEFMPRYQFREFHQIPVDSDPEVIFQTLPDMDLRRSFPIRALFRLRELPGKIIKPHNQAPDFGYTLRDMIRLGFIPLAEDPPHEICLGLVGRFWRPVPDIIQIPGHEFKDFDDPGYAKVVMNFHIPSLEPGKCRLTTETRIWCPNAKTQARFRPYWTIIRPFSGLIRREMLKIAKQTAEAANSMKGIRRCS